MPNLSEKPRIVLVHCLAINRYYVNCLIDYMLPSLFHEENSWFLDTYEVKILISTKKEDADVIRVSPIIEKLTTKISLDFHFLSEKVLSDSSAYRISRLMSEAHSYITERGISEKSVCLYLNPDQIVNNNYLDTVHQALVMNKVGVIAPATRMTYLTSALTYLNELQIQKPLCRGFTSKDLLKASMLDLHLETKSFFFNTNYFLSYQSLNTPTLTIFNNKDNTQFLGYSMTWFIVMVDFHKIPINDSKLALKTLNEHTLDAYFQNQLFKNVQADVHIVTDSDDIFVLSWDKQKHLSSLKVHDLNDSEKVELIEIGLLSGLYDNWKLKLYKIPWFWKLTNDSAKSYGDQFNIPIVFQELQRRKITEFDFFSFLKLLKYFCKYKKINRWNSKK